MCDKWTDATSYSQGQRGRVDPSAWEYTIPGVKIWICNAHLYYPGEWVMNAKATGLNERVIGPVSTMTLDQVKAEAIRLTWDAARMRAANARAIVDTLFAELEVLG